MWKKKPRENDDDPIKRIFNTILQFAIAGGVRQIRIELRRGVPIEGAPEGNEGIVVSYLFGADWKEQMKMPGYVHTDLLGEIRRRAALDATQNSGEIAIDLCDENNSFRLNLRVAVEITEDKTTLLSLHFADPEMDMLS